MKKKLIGILVCILLITAAVLPVASSTSVISAAQVSDVIVVDDGKLIDSVEYCKTTGDYGSAAYTPGDYLIDTQWEQRGNYDERCPTNTSSGQHFRLGCWSVAIGQIINYHRLQTKGLVDYECTRDDVEPKHIVNDLDDHEYNWSMHVNTLIGSTQDEIDNVSTFLFDISTVIQKDFGTGGYVILGDDFDVDAMINELIEHIDYIQPTTEWDDNLTEDEIISSINSNRPIMFYIKTLDNVRDGKIYHAVVIDGYQYNYSSGDKKFEVHINFGWDDGNPDPLENSWYYYYGVFPSFNESWSFDDTSFRKGMYIRYSPPPPEINGPQTGLPNMNYNFSALTVYDKDPPLYYKFDWGDGSFSDWLGRYDIGELCITSHMWKNKGKYEVKAKVKDANNLESDWSESLIVTMPINKPFNFNYPFLSWLFDHFPNAFPIIRYMLGQ